MTPADPATPFISIILPVKNAEKFLPACLKSLYELNYPRDKYEVIISDSDSRDRTREITASFGARFVIADGPSVCAGRNSGFKVSQGEIVAFSDADCVMDKDWIGNAVKYFSDETVACVGGVSLTPADETAFGKACGFIFSYPLFTGGSTYGMNFNRAREVKHNAGCNAIYRRSALAKVMPVDERFSEGEDVFMNSRLRKLGYRFLYTPDTIVWHYRSSTPKRFWRQNYRYGIGRVLLGRADRALMNPLHAGIGFSLPVTLLVLVSALVVNPAVFLALILLVVSFLVFFFFLGWLKTGSPAVAFRVPAAITLLAAGWSVGFTREFFFPARKIRKAL